MSPIIDDRLILRRVDHPHADDAHRVIWRGIEVGSIGLQRGAGDRRFWRWSIDDAGRPCRDITTSGDTTSQADAMAAFRAAWDAYAADADRIRHLIEVKANIAERARRWGPG